MIAKNYQTPPEQIHGQVSAKTGDMKATSNSAPVRECNTEYNPTRLLMDLRISKGVPQKIAQYAGQYRKTLRGKGPESKSPNIV